jgi:phosphoesterase RecJ-like protein
MQKINEEILRELSSLVQALKDPRVKGVISLTHVEASRDLALARVYVSVLGGGADAGTVVAGLKSAAGYLRRELAAALSLRRTPELQFIADDSLARGARIQQVLSDLRETEPPRRMITAADAARWLAETDVVFILTHQRPDGDTLGSAAALCAGLRSLGKTAYALENPDVTTRYAPYIADYLWPGTPPEDAVLVAVDIATPALLPKIYESLEDRVALVIDHHETNSGFGRLNCVLPDRASTGEIIFEVLDAMGAALTQTTALPLYLAVATDTGCFRYSNTTSRTHRVAAALIDTGIPFAAVNLEMFEIKSRRRFQTEALVLSETEFFDEGTVAFCYLTQEMLAKTQADEDDIDNISALPRKMEGVEIGVTLREQGDDLWKISVRTSQRWEANRICARFGGGGHPRAGGCHCRGDRADIRRQMLEAVAEVKALHGHGRDSDH